MVAARLYKPGDVLVEVRGGVVIELFRLGADGFFYAISPDTWDILNWDDVNDGVTELEEAEAIAKLIKARQ